MPPTVKRSTSRAIGLIALAVAAITCTDAPTAPGARGMGFNAVRLALAPSFSAAATHAYGALEAMGISVTQVRIRLNATDGSLARDTTIQFGAEDTLHLQLPVEIRGTEQTFSALIELLDAGGTVLFSQTQTVVARAAGLPPAPAPAITLEYVGPGAAARAITVAPTDVLVQSGAAAVLTAVGADASNAPVTNLLLGWTSSDTTLATVTATGTVATVRGTGRRGTVTITATSPTGLAGRARLSMLPAAARLAVIAGDSQTTVAGRLLAQPIVVELQGADGGPIPQAPVTFRAVTVGAALGTQTATTDSAGRASTTLTLGAVAGVYRVEATSGSVPAVTITASATAAPAIALVVVSGDAQADSTGATLAPLVVRATDEFGAAVPATPITWERSGLGAFVNAPSVTGADGAASATYLLGLVPGVDTIRATISGGTGAVATAMFVTRVIARGPNALAIVSGGGQSALPGVTLPAPLVAKVTDALGHPVAGVTVQWQSPVTGLATFATPAAVTDANGEARTTVTLGAVPGPLTVTASVGPLTASTTIGVDAVATVGTVSLMRSAKQLVPIRGSLPADSLAFVVRDSSGAPLGGAAVSFRLGQLSRCGIAPGAAVADANGVVSRAVTAGDAAGPCEVTAYTAQSQATAKIGVYAAGATHVWFGGTVDLDRAYDVPGNWLAVRDATESAPGPADVAYVPLWSSSPAPQLRADAALGGLMVDRSVVVDLNLHSLTVTGNVSAAAASVGNGPVFVGGAGSRVSGQFDELYVGRVDFCQSDAATLDSISVKVLHAVCTMTVSGVVAPDTLDAGGQSQIVVPAAAALNVVRGAAVTGTALNVAGRFYAGPGGATLAAARIDVASGGVVEVAGPTTLGRAGTATAFASGSSLFADRDITFDGSGTLAADQVAVAGNAVFSGTGTWSLPLGQLQLSGNLDVLSGQGAVFTATGDHQTRFVGSSPQTVSMAAGAGSFARASVQNRNTVAFKGRMDFTSDNLPLELGDGARVEMSNGPVTAANAVQLGKGASLTLFTDLTVRAGQLRLLDGSTFTVQEGWSFTGQCTQTVNAILSLNVTIGGLGLINGLPVDPLRSCLP